MTILIHNGVSPTSASPKDIDSDVWYGFTYTLEEGEVLLSSTWLINDVEVTPTDTVDSLLFIESVFSGTTTKIRVSGGVRGKRYKVTNRFTTNLVPSDDRSLLFSIVQL